MCIRDSCSCADNIKVFYWREGKLYRKESYIYSSAGEAFEHWMNGVKKYNSSNKIYEKHPDIIRSQDRLERVNYLKKSIK